MLKKISLTLVTLWPLSYISGAGYISVIFPVASGLLGHAEHSGRHESLRRAGTGSNLQLPPGFEIELIAEDLGYARWILVTTTMTSSSALPM